MKYLIYLITVLFFAGEMGCSKMNDLKNVNIKTPDGNEISTNKLPEGFPADFPIYKDAKIITSTKTGKNFTITFEINDKADAVGNFYKTELPKAGYEADKDNDKMMASDRGIITFQKSGKYFDLTYNYKEAAGKTYLTVLER